MEEDIRIIGDRNTQFFHDAVKEYSFDSYVTPFFIRLIFSIWKMDFSYMKPTIIYYAWQRDRNKIYLSYMIKKKIAELTKDAVGVSVAIGTYAGIQNSPSFVAVETIYK